MSPYGDFDTMLATVLGQFANAPYLLGNVFSAADLLWGTALNWGMMFKLVPETSVVADYVKRVTARPSFIKVAAMDAELACSGEARPCWLSQKRVQPYRSRVLQASTPTARSRG